MSDIDQKKKKKSWFSSFRKKDDFIEEEDIYYGIQAKSFSDLKTNFDDTGELKLQDESFLKLFDKDSSIDEEAELNFQKIQRERRRRVAAAVETAGVDFDDMQEEFGVIAPMPVTSDTVEINEILKDNVDDDFQKAILNTATMPTMEIKLNILNDTVEVQNKVALPEIDEETINNILERAKAENEEDEAAKKAKEEAQLRARIQEKQDDEMRAQLLAERHAQMKAEQNDGPQVEQEPEPEQVNPVVTDGKFEDIQSASDETQKSDAPPEVGKAKLIAQFDGSKQVYKASDADEQNTVYDLQIPLEEIDKREILTDVTKYRSKNMPLHIINMDILQTLVNSESKKLKPEAKIQDSKKRRLVIEKEVEEPEDINENEYNSKDDAKEVSAKLRKERTSLSFKILFTGIITVALFVFVMSHERTFTLSNQDSNSAFIYICVNLAAVLAVFLTNFKCVLGGIASVFKFKPSGDSTLSIAMVAVLTQSILAFFNQDLISQGYAYVYGVVILTGVFLNLLGKLMMVRRVYGNFRFITSREQKYAVKIYDNTDNATKFVGDTVVGKPCIAYQKKTSFLRNFLEISYAPDPAQTSGGALTPIALIFSLVLCMMSMLIYKDFYMGISVFAAACCAAVAMGNMISANGPINKLCKKIRRSGAMVSGYKAIKEMAKVNSIMVDCADLFPSGTVILEGVKTYGGEDEDECMRMTVALLTNVGGTLSDVMEQIAQDDIETLPAVSNIVYEDEHGVTASVDGKKVLIGNRTLLLNHHVLAPERDDVVKYTGEGKKVVFVAIEDKLRAMLILSYKTDKRKINELKRLESNGVSILIRTTDPNITPNMISEMFDIAKSSVNIISGDLGMEYGALVNTKLRKENAYIATKGRIESLMAVISSCASQKSTVSLIVAVQVVGIILALVLVTFLTITQEFSLLSAMNLLIYQLFWVIASLFISRR